MKNQRNLSTGKKLWKKLNYKQNKEKNTKCKINKIKQCEVIMKEINKLTSNIKLTKFNNTKELQRKLNNKANK